MIERGDQYEAALRRLQQSDERLWLNDVINRLEGRPVWKCHEVQYWNHPELPEHLQREGYYVCYQSADRAGYPLYVMISRSHTNEALTLENIVENLRSSDIVLPFEKFGDYYAKKSTRRGPGKHATIRFGKRCYMLSICGTFKPYYNLVVETKPEVRTPALTYDDLKKRMLDLRAKRAK